MKNKKLRAGLLAVVLAASMLAGCTPQTVSNLAHEVQQSQQESKSSSTSSTAPSSSSKSESNPAVVHLSSFQYSSVPAYSGNPSVTINGNAPFFTDEDKQVKDGYETYSDLDSMGRCGVAYAKIGTETMPTQTRGEIGMVKPTGWHTVKYPGIVDGNYLYNRCHLIGYQLAGENANTKNLITGTRYLNVAGMEPYENLVADYVKATKHHVFYRVTPYFNSNNLLADGVLMEGQSEEDNGVQFCVWVYNLQPGINIDHATGDSSAQSGYTGGSQGNEMPQAVNNGTFTPRPAGNFSDRDQKQSPKVTTSPDDGHNYNGNSYSAKADTTYIINTNTKKFHRPTCPSVKRMASGNTVETNKSRSELISEGYTPCDICKP